MDKIRISELGNIVDRKPDTIRKWEKKPWFPGKFKPYRDEKGRWWTVTQAESLVEWIALNDLRPGRGLENYNPSSEDIERHLKNMRRSK